MNRTLFLVVLGVAVVVTACADSDGSGDGDGADAVAAQGSEPVAVEVVSSSLHEGIEVTGVGVTDSEPDAAVVRIGVEVTRPTAAAASRDAASETEKVFAALAFAGVEESDVQTSELRVNPDYDYSGSRPRITGYVVSNRLEVTVRDLEAVSPILDVVTEEVGDETRIDGVGFILDDNSEAVVAARAQAMEAARASAEQMATAAGVELGPALSIIEEQSPVDSRFREDLNPEAFDAASRTATPVAVGEVDTTVSVRIRYSLR